MNFFLKFLVTIHCFGDFSFFLHFWNQILSSKPNFHFCCWNALLLVACQIVLEFSMMTSQKGNIFRVTSSLSGDHTGHRWIPLTKASGAELWCFLWSEQTAEQTLEMALTCDAIALIMTSLLCSNLNCSFACIGCIYIYIMTSSNGNIFRVTGHLCGEFTGPRWIPLTKPNDADLWCLRWSASE